MIVCTCKDRIVETLIMSIFVNIEGSLFSVFLGDSFVVLLCCLFWCQNFGDVSPYVCPYYFSSVSVAEWPPFGK